ncbi:hypothetical protein L7F22_035155 [Adiantum nelumboides]|nr:hypothetical protein [Adiantum nelumboides]
MQTPKDSFVRKLIRNAACRVKGTLLSLASPSAANPQLYERLRDSTQQLITQGRRPSLSSSSSDEEEEGEEAVSSSDTKIPKGFLPVRLGPDYSTCYFIRTALLAHPLLAPLLEMSAHQFGYADRGALKLPCDALHFEDLLHAIAKSSSSSHVTPPLVHSISHSTRSELPSPARPNPHP